MYKHVVPKDKPPLRDLISSIAIKRCFYYARKEVIPHDLHIPCRLH